MSRAAIHDALLADARLAAIGLDRSSIIVNYDADQRPNDEIFIVLGWQSPQVELRGDDIFERESQSLTIWVHIYSEFSTDYNRIRDIIDIIDEILGNMIHVDGADGDTVTMVVFEGNSRDMRDDVYQTICRSRSYKVLSRRTATV